MKTSATDIVEVSRLESLRGHLASLETDTLLICVDEAVDRLHGLRLSLDSIPGKAVALYRMPGGEEAKTIHGLTDCLEFFLSRPLHRKAQLIAVGGGSMSDTAGLAASLLLRGIPGALFQHPPLHGGRRSRGKDGREYGGNQKCRGGLPSAEKTLPLPRVP